MDVGDGFFGQFAQLPVEQDGFAPVCLSVIQCAFGYGGLAHFFQTHRLCAELDAIGVGLFRASALVFDGIRLPMAVRPVKFDDIGHPADAEPFRAQHQRGGCPDVFPAFCPGGMGVFVHEPPLCRKDVFFPCSVQMDQGTLARTIQVVLQRRYGDEIGFRV